MSGQVNPLPTPLEVPGDEEIELPPIVQSDPHNARNSHSVINNNPQSIKGEYQNVDTIDPDRQSEGNRASILEDEPIVLPRAPLSRMENFKLGVKAVVESNQVTALMALLTIWALFGNDIRLAATGKEADNAFLILISIIFFLFLLEIVAVMFYKPEYFLIPVLKKKPGETTIQTTVRILTGFGSFYFWLDLVATVSLIFEITWILPSLGNTKAGASSKAGTRAARLVRIVRMVRLVRLVKLYKYATKRNEEVEIEKESHVGAAMSDLTNRRVIVLILSMLIIIPLLTITSDDSSGVIVTKLLHSTAHFRYDNPAEYSELFFSVVESAIKHSSVIGIELNGEMYWQNEGLMNKLRPGVEAISYSAGSRYPVVITFNHWESSIYSAQYSIGTTIFVTFLLTTGAILLTNDVDRLIIKPIERMVELVDRISENPLGVKYEMLGEEDGFVQGMETTILLSTITKIGALMKVGFGEAGANVIARNLRDSTNGKLNLMGGGELITSIFGFCDVRQFTDTTECLQEEVMLFVNRIAHILHGIVAQCSGSANKNIGDAFLLTWKLDVRYSEAEITSLADQALFAFCKTLVELIRYEEFICNFSIAATQRLYKRFSDYHVRIGCGLHVGWAIEGAIGSEKKIDASYLSPHVNFTEFLESSTKEYGVALLISEMFYKLLSPTAKKYCRQVDRVRRSHDEDPVSLYTYDSDLTIDFADPNRKRPNAQPTATNSGGRGLSSLRLAAMRVVTENRRQSVQLPSLQEGGAQGAEGAAPAINMVNPRRTSLPAARAGLVNQTGDESKGDVSGPHQGVSNSNGQLRTQYQTPIINVPLYDPSLWDSDIDVVDLRHRVNDVFRAIWAEGMAYYINGGSDWQKARDKFQETLRMSRNRDGPSKFIVSILDKHLGSCPHNWEGFRDLSEDGGGH